MPDKSRRSTKQITTQTTLRGKLPHQQKQRDNTEFINRKTRHSAAFEQIEHGYIAADGDVAQRTRNKHSRGYRHAQPHEQQHAAKHQ